MSKAFTKEDSGAELPLVRPPVRIAPGQPRYITPEGFARLERDREVLSAARQAEPARAAELEARLTALDALIGGVTVVQPSPAQDKILFGAWVDLEDQDGNRSSFRLVGPDESDAPAGLLSVDSPLARALLGKTVGDVVLVH